MACGLLRRAALLDLSAQISDGHLGPARIDLSSTASRLAFS
jgi:hypothetical protein